MPERSRSWPHSRRIRMLVSGVALGAGLVFLAGCSTEKAPTPGTATAPAPAAPTAAPTAATPKPDPTFQPDLAASGNQDYFDWIAAGVLAADRDAGGRAFIDALAGGGFDKSQMEVTFDETAIDLEADSVQFSVRVRGECLIGQVGPESAYRSIVVPMLGSGTCLVGATRQIDW